VWVNPRTYLYGPIQRNMGINKKLEYVFCLECCGILQMEMVRRIMVIINNE
jgi:hypothetical protein